MAKSASEGSRKIGIALFNNAMNERFLHGIIEFARPFRDWTLVREWPTLEGVERLLSQNIDGLIGQLVEPQVAACVVASRVPAVNTSNARVVEGLTTVKSDDRVIGQLAADHLVGRGARSFGFAGEAPQTLYVEERRNGFVRRLGELGRSSSCSERMLILPDTLLASPEARAPLVEWLATLPKPLGLLCSTDRLAYHVQRSCRDHGIDLVRDLWVLGVDNDPAYCEGSSPPFSSIALGNIGYRAAEALERLLKGQRVAPVTRVQPRQLVVRAQETDAPLMPGEVHAALQYIGSHLGEPIQVADVLQHVPMSRRALELRFKRATGRTIYQEIQRQRLDRARSLLESTQWPIDRVAQASGFADACLFSHVFRQHVSMSPRQYRKSKTGPPN